MRLFRANVIRRNVVLLTVFFLSGACTKYPIWLPEFKALLENTNREIEAILPLLTQDTSPENLYVGMRRLDKSSDQMIIDLKTFFEKYPYIFKEKIAIGIHLRKQIDRFGKNLNQAFAAGIAWDKKIGHQNEYRQLSQRFKEKIKQFKILLDQAIARADE